jgi:lipopolysaccharide export system permease protein
MLGFDLMNNGKTLPDSANLVIIYGMYKWLYALDMMLPISLVFAFIATIIALIRSNALTAFYALGYSRMKVLSPILFVATTLLSVYIAAHTTSFARANEYADNLRESSEFLIPTNNLFFAHEGNYIFFGTLNPLAERAETIRLFTFEKGKLKEALSAPDAYYKDHYWNIKRAHIVRPPEALDLKGKGITIQDVQNIRVLRDFRPKILDQIYEGKKNYTITDALDAMKLLEFQNIDLSKVKSSLYRNFFTPWFAFMMIILIYAYAPVGSRSANLSLYSFGSILVTLIVWGLLFMSGELANNKTLSPEVGIVAPIGILALLSALHLSSFWIKSRINSVQKG